MIRQPSWYTIIVDSLLFLGAAMLVLAIFVILISGTFYIYQFLHNSANVAFINEHVYNIHN